MEDRSDAFLTLPGGIGTLEELFETWTAGYLGMHDKPVVLLDPARPLRRATGVAASLVANGYVAQAALERLVVMTDIDAAVAACGQQGDEHG